MGKSPCGSVLGRTELKKCMFYASTTQKQGFSIYKKRRCIFCRETAPAGAHLVAPSLESIWSMYCIRKKQRFSIYKYRRCILVDKKAPAGAHLVAPSLDNTDSVYVKYRGTDFVYIIHRKLCLRHRQCVYLRHINLCMYYI